MRKRVEDYFVSSTSLPDYNSAVSALSVADEVDVIGYTSNQSDTDDHSSVQSSSDSGVAMSTSRLTLSEMMDNL
jgi:MAX dimerization protein